MVRRVSKPGSHYFTYVLLIFKDWISLGEQSPTGGMSFVSIMKHNIS